MILFAFVGLISSDAFGQVRGQYTPGMTATNSGTMADPGFTYANFLQYYSFSKFRGPDGATITAAPGSGFSLLVDHNIVQWVSEKKFLGGNFAVAADIPIANSSLSLAALGVSGGGAGIADLYIQPVTLGWKTKRMDAQVAYGFVIPVGRYSDGASDNVGTGYWGHQISSGQTFYLTKNKATAVSAYENYEFHSKQRDTDIRPGQTFNLDYSVTQLVPLKKDMSSILQVGFVGYEQIQTTDNTGAVFDPDIASRTHYRVNAAGFATNLILPAKKVLLGFKYYKEFGNRSTVEGYSVQFNGAITF